MTKTIGKKTSAETWVDTLDPATTPARDGRHLREIGRALTALEQSEIDLRDAVGAARAAGDSWEAIGLVLGTSRQGAHRKFAPRTSPHPVVDARRRT
ncbi:MAG: hypothetical protein ACOH2F_08930 [Cellulomonas sp.]